LDLSRLEDPAGVPEEPTDLAQIAHHEFEELNSAAAAKNMELIERIAPEVWVRGDDEQIALMVRNLLENAVRYTSDGGNVTLGVTDRDGWAIVTVTDTGIGIPREAQGRVFERFYRVDRARSRDRGGTGLGLAIVKHVAELHGGHVAVESVVGEGSTFTVSLPLLELRETSGHSAAV
jgi:signal transduction histidine kinase